jgi:hypothetical protein
MVKSVNLGLKVKVLGPLLPIRGVGGHRYMISYIGWGYCGWVGGWARKLASAIYIINKRVSERAQRAPRGEASAPRSGAQPTLEEYQSSNVIYSFGKCLANQSQPCCTVL